MANLELQIQEFLKINDTDSDYCFGVGYGDGYDSGYGNGYSDSYGFGSGTGYGYGFGTDSGYGYCYDDECDDDYFWLGLLSINNQKVLMVDNIPTVISKIKNNIAKGYIIKKDFTLEPCYIAKGNNLFAHGSTIKEAVKSLQDKIFENLPVEERINEFTKHFDKDKKYKGSIFFEWHNKLTGSCLMGRNMFVEEKGLSLDDEYTVLDFINLTKNSYGGEIIRKLEKYYQKEERK